MGAARGVIGRVVPYARTLALTGTAIKLGLAASDSYTVATSNDTRAAKTQGFAGIAGSLAGGAIGAKAGATIGAIGGPIVAVVGGLAGGALGTFGGEKALGAIAKWASARNDAQQPVIAEALAKVTAQKKAPGVDKPVAKIDQQNTFAPVFHVTFQGEPGSDAADRFLAQVSPQLQRMMKAELSKSNRTALFDSPHL